MPGGLDSMTITNEFLTVYCNTISFSFFLSFLHFFCLSECAFNFSNVYLLRNVISAKTHVQIFCQLYSINLGQQLGFFI